MADLTPKWWNPTKVLCLSSSRADERPLSFLLDDREIKVRTILKSWREPDYLCFRVETEDGQAYDLRHHEYEDCWEVRESRKR